MITEEWCQSFSTKLLEDASTKS